MTHANIARRAHDIAGAAWDDRDETVGEGLTPGLRLAAQLNAVVEASALGSDGDLPRADRVALAELAEAAADGE